MLTVFAENFLRAPFASWQVAQIARAEICFSDTVTLRDVRNLLGTLVTVFVDDERRLTASLG